MRPEKKAVIESAQWLPMIMKIISDYLSIKLLWVRKMKAGMKMKYDFFISYCREEITSTAYPLYRALTKLGFNVWMDRDKIIPGQQIYTTIDGAIGASFGVIAIIATPYLTRPWTVHELKYTLELEKEQ